MSIKDKYQLSVINILLNMLQAKKAEKLNDEQLNELQQRRLAKLLKHVMDHSEFYKTFYEEHGITVDKIESVKIHDLPIIDKELMMKNFNRFVCDKGLKKNDLEKFLSDPEMSDSKYDGIYEVIHTSGSSGSPGIYVYGPNDWSLLKAIVINRVSKNKFHLFKKTKLAYIGLIDGHYAGISLTKDAPKLLFDFLPVDIGRPIKESVEKLNKYMPESLSGYASGVYLLALEQLEGRLNIYPSRILCSAETLTDQMAKTIHKAFGIKPINFYAATESIGMASQCDLHDEIHLFNDWHIYEVIKENGEPAKPGEIGHLVVTTLYNYTQPLIRYKMHDEVVLSDKTCSCGWSFPLISRIAGREEEQLWFEDSSSNKDYLHPTIFIEFFVIGLEKLQVVQVEQNTLQLNVVITGDSEIVISKIIKRMDDILDKKGFGSYVKFSINIVDSIPNDEKTGKYRLIIPLKTSLSS
ncbi:MULTISPECIES: phenylacetate--CoA ligase family protein [unclassified Fusibacter]|uniref:phenylacetate--CoA ligase family protein n=1 Tax=unclassified Fusibacter TaxID=2624464 RepID=UPI00101143B1|nr:MULTISPECIES: phenylacetate--CoA ligase family protein [unclassified Fusibacter]MCK8059168.1 phenylacetate--CoA ligase family protein [Fusibacter sp. A2]NPE22577.1 phenylacetate--CoA ligase family protein [Fusibacter sp. A1]RXV60678.1 phenylacetate--CoA ligase family protein [Fusibacter sp. A1]